MKVQLRPGQLWQVQKDTTETLRNKLYLIRGYDASRKAWMVWLFDDRHPDCHWLEKEMKDDKLVCDVEQE